MGQLQNNVIDGVRGWAAPLWGVSLGCCLVVGGCGSREEPRPSHLPVQVTGGEEKPQPADIPGKVVTVEVEPRDPGVGSELTARVVTEGDVSLVYSWRVGGQELVGETADTLSGVFQRGDRVQVRVTPYRGNWTGQAVDAPAVMIRNSPPQWVGDPNPGMELDGFQLRADDADGDPVTWRLSGGPPGLTLDSDGTFHYVPQVVKESREWTVEISGSDGHGGVVRAGFSLLTRPGI